MNNNTLLLIIGIAIAFITIIAAGFQFIYSIQQIQKSKETILKAESKVDAEPEKVKPSWDLARITLEFLLQSKSKSGYLYILA